MWFMSIVCSPNAINSCSCAPDWIAFQLHKSDRWQINYSLKPYNKTNLFKQTLAHSQYHIRESWIMHSLQCQRNILITVHTISCNLTLFMADQSLNTMWIRFHVKFHCTEHVWKNKQSAAWLSRTHVSIDDIRIVVAVSFSVCRERFMNNNN